jgi:hypothetical protein
MSKSEGRALPQEEEGELVNVRELVDFSLVSQSFEDHKREAIGKMRGVGSLKEAVQIARDYGYNPKFAWVAWNKIIRRGRV